MTAEPVPATPPPGPAHQAPSGGRNVPVATAVGLALAALVIGSLYLWTPLFVGVACVAAVIALVELAGALAPSGVRIPLPPVLVGGVGIIVAAYVAGTDGLVAVFALTCAVVVAWRAVEGVGADGGFVRDVAAGAFALAYVPLLLGFAMLMVQESYGPERIVAVVLLVACSDTGGFLVGSRLGRHPIAPSISPKKSWEGSAGSVVLTGVVGALVLPLMIEPLAWWQGLVLGLVLVVTATVGDLGESLIKRDLGIKDMSALLPGHGGLLDRIDSLLVSIPVAWMIFALVLA
jgi:phosphatidate cytidylyltransferase